MKESMQYLGILGKVVLFCNMTPCIYKINKNQRRYYITLYHQHYTMHNKLMKNTENIEKKNLKHLNESKNKFIVVYITK